MGRVVGEAYRRSALRGVGKRIDDKPRDTRDTVERMEESRPRLVERARKRTVHAVQRSDFPHAWLVDGDPKFSDAFADYLVVWNADTRKYICDCNSHAHGETRGMCSHKLAVIMYRKEHRDAEPVQTEREETSDVHRRTPNCAEGAPGSALLVPTSSTLTPSAWAPPPEWLTGYRQVQIDAAHEIVEAFGDGKRVVFVDAPPGSGKTALGDLVSRLLVAKSVYMCTTKSLQEQVLTDFPYAKVLKGRANYPTMSNHAEPDLSCEDCDGAPEDDNCSYCRPMAQCAYRVAKRDAIRAQMAVLNTAYWLREANSAGAFSRPAKENGISRAQQVGGFFIVDECDIFENALLGYIDFTLTSGRCRQLNVTPPKKGSHAPTIAKFLEGELQTAIEKECASIRRKTGLRDVRSKRAVRGLMDLAAEALRVAPAYGENWCRDNDAAPLSLKPIKVAPFCDDLVWHNMGRAMLMSGTIISADEMADSLGLEDNYTVVRVPMTFAKENRPIHIAPIVDMKGGQRAAREDGRWTEMAKAIQRVIALHPDERVLCHTVSYGLATFLHEQLSLSMGTPSIRPLMLYSKASERDGALERFRTTERAVLFAPSFDRGVDLKDDDCRVQIVAKVPFPNLGDEQTSRRRYAPGGDSWYIVNTIRSIVQMTGRGVRTEDDWCVTYILDAGFKSLSLHNKSLLPTWWRDALNTRFRVRDLTD